MKGLPPTPLPELLAVLPKEYTALLGQITIPNNLQILYDSLCDGDLIAASDGSVRDVDNMGSYGYVLSHKVRDDVQLKGCQKITGIDSLCSLTTEHCGVLCVVLILYMMSLQYDDCPTDVKVKVYCDNDQVVTRSNDKDYVKVKVSEYTVMDYDLWKLTQEIQALLPFHVEYHWVKSHQDENKDGKPIYGPFARNAELNIMADKLCTQAYQSEGSLASIPQHEFAGFYFSHEGVVINNYSRHIGMKTWQHKIDAYYKERRQWDTTVLSTIHWEAQGQWLKSIKLLRRIRAMKFIHQWQYVKHQEVKFKVPNGEGETPKENARMDVMKWNIMLISYTAHNLQQWNFGRYDTMFYLIRWQSCIHVLQL